MSSVKGRLFSLGLNELNYTVIDKWELHLQYNNNIEAMNIDNKTNKISMA